MDLDDIIEFAGDNPEWIERRIKDYMRSNHPEYLLPGSYVNQAFIKLVIYGDLLEETVGTPVVMGETVDITDDDIEEVLDRLPSDIILNPLSLDTIDLIIEESFLVQEERHLKEVVDSPCVTAADFNYRAFARAEFERVEEAIEDYRRAYELEPGNYSHLIDKADLLLDADMNDDALRDAMYVCERLMSCVDRRAHINDLIRLADIFLQGARLRLAAACIIIAVQTLKSIVCSKEDTMTNGFNDRLRMESPDIAVNLGLLVSFIDAAEFEYRDKSEFSEIIEHIKSEINVLRAVTGD